MRVRMLSTLLPILAAVGVAVTNPRPAAADSAQPRLVVFEAFLTGG